LEAEGYEVLPFLLPACATNAPHRRDRIWFVAYSNGFRQSREKYGQIEPRRITKESEEWITTNTDITRIHEQHITPITNKKKQHTRSSFAARCFSTFPTEPPICGGDDGLPKELDNITFSKWRNESIKAYGNAIVPQVAYQIFKSICQYQEL
jgi:DNA (cytosine-5)-methyltransferase 1